MRATATRRAGVLLLIALAAGLGATGCGTSAEDDYAAGWDGVCGDVRDAYRDFRTDVVSAARTSPDVGDAAAARPLEPAAASADLARPVRRLEQALRAPLRDARRLDPPARWAAWDRTAVRRMAAQAAVVRGASSRAQAGATDGLSGLALGGFGPAAADAPAALRDETPVCTALR